VAKTALIVVDMLNHYEHEDADKLARSVEDVVGPLRGLIDRAADEDVMTVYVNDNHDRWESNRKQLIASALGGARPDLVEPLVPRDEDLFIAKTRHSIFYASPIEYILEQEDIDRIVLAGQVTEQCILYSALDAHIRHLDVAVPRDAVAHIFEDLADASLRMMERNMHADVCTAGECRLGERH
jgi:nicotinamidase-related amidase